MDVRRLALWTVLATGAPTLDAQIQFEPLVPVDVPTNLKFVHLADLDEDGNVDLLTSPGGTSILGGNHVYNVLKGNGDGTFAAPLQGQTVNTSFFGRGEIADVDDDGHLDWVAPTRNFLYIFHGDGGLLFPSFTDTELSTGVTIGPRAHVVDLFPGDDYLEVVTQVAVEFPQPTDYGAVVFSADAQGDYTWGGGSLAYPDYQTELLQGHLDGDGLLDLVMADSSSVSIFLGTGPGAWTNPPTALDLGGAGQKGLALAPLDGDGTNDILISRNAGLWFFAGNGDGTFAPGVLSPVALNQVVTLETSDLDGDGDLDVVRAGLAAANPVLQILEGAGDGTFTLVEQLPLSCSAAGADLADLDGDGDPDLVVGLASPFAACQPKVGILVNRSYGPSSPFTDLGQALAGTSGEPTHLADGTMLPASDIAFDLFDAAPSSLVFLVVGATAINAPFFGGVFVPAPDELFALGTDADGKATLGGQYAGNLPAGFEFFTQWWLEDAGGPFGWAGSNAVSVTVP